MSAATVHPASGAQWRAWLAQHHDSATEVWLVIPRARSSTTGVTHREATEEALCFGWIDSHARRHDAESWWQRFSPRRRRSTWSATNRGRVEQLEAQGRMTPAGRAAIDRAKALGTWHPRPR